MLGNPLGTLEELTETKEKHNISQVNGQKQLWETQPLSGHVSIMSMMNNIYWS